MARLPALAAAALALLPLRAVANWVSVSQRYTADPAPLVVDGRVYMTTSHDLEGMSLYTMKDYSLVSSADLVNWLDHGIVFNVSGVTWGPGGAWAQQVLGPVDSGDGAGGVCRGCFVMYWPNIVAHSNNTGSGVGIAISRAVTGPYVDVTPNNTAFMPGDDPTVYRDPATNATYLCSNPGDGGPFCGVLGEDLMSWAVPPVRLQNTSNLHWFEAPWLMQQPNGSGQYLMTYMCPSRNEQTNLAGHYGQDICAATAPAALGPYTYAGINSALQWSPPYDCDVAWSCSLGGGGNAHHGIFQLGGSGSGSGSGSWYLAYHTRLLSATRGATPSLRRNVGLDRLYVQPGTGLFHPVTVTPSWLRQLAWVDPYAAPVPGALMAAASHGVDTVPVADATDAGQSRAVVFPAGGVSWVKVVGVDFGSGAAGAQNVTFRALLLGGQANATQPNATAPGASIALAVDDVAGVPVAACAVPPGAAAEGGWATVTCPVRGAGVRGVRDVYLIGDTLATLPLPSTPAADVLPGGSVQLAWWQVGGGAASGETPPPVVVPCKGLTAKANGLLLASPAAPSGGLAASAGAPSALRTAFYLVDNEDASYALLSQATGTYACAGSAAGAPVTLAATSAAQPCARFRVLGTTDGSYAIFALSTADAQAAAPLALAVDAASGALSVSNATDPRYVAGDAARFWLECGDPLRDASALPAAVARQLQ